MTSTLQQRTRTCGIAARMGERVACPEGGCRLAIALGMAPDPEGLLPCPVEVLALKPPRCPLALATLDQLRRALDAGDLAAEPAA